jgi:hypothetical protein
MHYKGVQNNSEVTKLWGASPGGAVGPLGGGRVCMKAIFILM